MARKRNAKPVVQPTLSVEEAIAVLTRTLMYVSTAGIKIEWSNFRGNLALKFNGLTLVTNKETGTARIEPTKDVEPVEMVKQ